VKRPYWTFLALRELRRNYTRKGVWMWLRREVVDWRPPSRRVRGWKWLLADPEAVYRHAGGVSEGVFT
jgi:hypothetical protein